MLSRGIRVVSSKGTMEVFLAVEDDTLDRVENFMFGCFLQVQTVTIHYQLTTSTSWECESVLVYGQKFNKAGQRLSGLGGLSFDVPHHGRPEWLRSVVSESWPEPIG